MVERSVHWRTLFSVLCALMGGTLIFCFLQHLNFNIARCLFCLLHALLQICLDVYFLFPSDFEFSPREFFFLKTLLLFFHNFAY